MFDWKSKNIVIAGGSSGIGKALALHCAQLGANIAIIAHQEDKISETIKELEPFHIKAKGYTCDVSDLEKLRVTSRQIFNDFGQIDVLVNNAGFATYKTFHELTVEEIDSLTRVNYLGAVYLCKFFLDEMMKQGQGHVVNVGSVSGKIPITPNALYSAAKHGLSTITELLDCEYSPFGIHFSLVLPGRVDTPFFDHETFKNREQRPEIKGMLKPQQVAEAIAKVIEHPRREVYIPLRYKFITAVFDFVPQPFMKLYRSLLVSRITSHYNHVGWPNAKIPIQQKEPSTEALPK